MLLPVGAVEVAHPSVKGIATKAFRWGRVNASSEAVFGDEPMISSAREGLARWETGVAVDRAFARRALLLAAELVARQPMDRTAAVAWTAAAGASYQLTSWVSLDGAVGYTFAGVPGTWNLSAAITRRFVVPGVLPGTGRWGGR